MSDLPEFLQTRDYAQAVADQIWGGRFEKNPALHEAGWDDAWDFGREVWLAMVAAYRGEEPVPLDAPD